MTTSTETTYRCRACGGRYPANKMRKWKGRVIGTCLDCHQEQQRKLRAEQRDQRQRSSVDPCRWEGCGIPQAQHWRCRICTARGHEIPRSRHDRTICLWCEQNIINGRLSTAA